MAVYNYILVRDSLEDTGTVPSPGYPCTAPDMIPYQTQVADPATFFKNNYDQDAGQAIEFGGEPNFIYVRGKNLADSTKSGYMFVYWSKGSLLLIPSQWTKNQLQVLKPGGGQVPYVQFNNLAPQEIRAGSDHFTWVPTTREHSCLVGVMSPTSIPNIPAAFKDTEAFISWVRNSQNVCWRNINIVNEHPDPSYLTMYAFGNLDSSTIQIFFQIVASDNIPTGTTLTMICEAIGLNWSQTITADPASRTLIRNGSCPPGIEYTLNVEAYLPQGKTWPTEAMVSTTAWIAAMAKQSISKYGVSIKKFKIPKNTKIADGYNNGYLVRLGNCSYKMV